MDQLGYDHSMTKLYPEMPKDERYRVQVAGEHYITTQVLANYAAERMASGAVRVSSARTKRATTLPMTNTPSKTAGSSATATSKSTFTMPS